MSLIAELKRRNVVRVAIAYGVVAWLLAQVADLLFGAFGAPDWALRTFVILLFLGFPVALLLAWAFELTPEGIRRESATDDDRPTAPASNRKLDTIIVGVLALAVGFLFLDRFVISSDDEPRSDTSADLDASIAVLPFDNRSADPNDEHFVDGIHDDILTQLARIQSLKVISRTSVMRYGDTIKSVPEIAAELGVAAILEGGVQRAGDSVRINVQLIDAVNDEHLWAETYDRQLNTSNIFEIQSEIAAAVAQAFHTTLDPNLTAQIATAPTDNLQAYDAFQKANGVLARSNWGTSSEAADLLEEAVLLDPTFAEAYRRLGGIYVNHYWYFGHDEAYLRRAKAALDRALELQPDDPQILITLADYYYKGFLDFDRALELLDEAIPRAPQLSTGIARRAFIQRRSGRLEESITGQKKALELDPLAASRHYSLAQTLDMVGRYEEAAEYYDSAIAISPRDYTFLAARAYNKRALDPESTAIGDLLYHPDYIDRRSIFWFLYRWRIALLEHDYDAAMDTLSKSRSNLLDINQAYYPMDLMVALTEFLLGDRDTEPVLFGSARIELEAARRESPDDTRILEALALTYAGLGTADEAIAAANAAVELVPISRDAVSGPGHVLNRARAFAMLGDDDAALADLKTLMSVPLIWIVGPVVIRNDPTFKHLHGDPDFEALFADEQTR